MDKDLFTQTAEACKMVTDRFGRDILTDKKRFCAAFGDFAPKLSKEKKALYLALSENTGKYFLREDEAVRSGEITAASVIQRASSELCDYLNPEKSEMVAKSLAFALGWELPEETAVTEDITLIDGSSSVIEELFRKAESGDNDACFNLGERFYYGRGVKQDYEKAVYWYTQSSDRGDGSSQKKLAECLRLGQGTPQDCALAAKRYTQAAEQGDYDSQKALILLYQNGGTGLKKNIDTAEKLSERYGIPLSVSEIDELTEKAKSGSADAQFRLGNIYWLGSGTAADHAEAVKWYKMAADNGDPNAIYSLACCYYKGDGIPCDQSKAAELFMKAALQGDRDALNNLAKCYFMGEGVTHSRSKAASYFRKAAESGHTAAQYNLAECFFHGWGEDVNYKKAIMWYKKAAEQSMPEAQYSYGWCCFNGLGIQRDLCEAKRMFEAAASQNYTPAKKMLGYCWMNGMGTAKNLTTAVEWFGKAANRGDAEAAEMMVVCYKYGGEYLEKNEAKAKQIAEKFKLDYDKI